MHNIIENDELTEVVRTHNRALRRIVKHLRKNVQRSSEAADNLFTALCDTNPAAELAMRELWESGEFTCGPQDYDSIVKQSIEAMKSVTLLVNRERRKVQIEQAAQAHSLAPCKVPSEIGAYGWSCTRESGHGGPCAMVHDH